MAPHNLTRWHLIASLLVAMTPAAWAQPPTGEGDQPLPGQVALAPIPEGKALLYLFNGSGRTLFAPKSTFKIDGKQALKLGRHQYSMIAIDPGQHQFQVVDRKLTLELQGGQYAFVMYAYHPEKGWAFPIAGKPDVLVALPEERARELLAEYRYSPSNNGTQ